MRCLRFGIDHLYLAKQESIYGIFHGILGGILTVPFWVQLEEPAIVARIVPGMVDPDVGRIEKVDKNIDVLWIVVKVFRSARFVFKDIGFLPCVRRRQVISNELDLLTVPRELVSIDFHDRSCFGARPC